MVNVSCIFYTFANLIVESGLYNQTEAWRRLLDYAEIENTVFRSR